MSGYLPLRQRIDEIVARTSHDEARFVAIAEVAEPALRQYVVTRRSVLGPHVGIEDVVQDVLLKAWRHWWVVEPRAITAWLYRITTNVLMDHGRRLQLHRRVGGVDWCIVSDPEQDDDDHLMIVDPQDVEVEVMSRDAYERVASMLAMVGAGGRYLTAFADGRSLVDIARDDRCTVDTVKSAMWRARARLKRMEGTWV